MTEDQAVMALRLAIAQGKAKQFIETLWDGGTFMVNPDDGQMIFVSEDSIKAALGEQ